MTNYILKLENNDKVVAFVEICDIIG